jgi:hypothetical protein
VQTFLPYPDFSVSAAVLDNKRLGKQRVEVVQVLNALQRKSGGWVNHPAVRMWRGYEPALCLYLKAVLKEWTSRGFKNTIVAEDRGSPAFSPWLGDDKFHRSHRSNLLRKDPSFYAVFRHDVPNDLPYFWPV